MTTKTAIIQQAMEDTGEVMPTHRYRTAMAMLQLHPSDLRTQYWLGLSRRQLIRIHQGHSPVPGPLARLLNLYLRFGLTE